MNAVVGGGAGLLVMGVLEWRSVKGGIINGSTGALCACVWGQICVWYACINAHMHV